MPGFLVSPVNGAAGVTNIPSGNISSTNIQDAINELDTEKTTPAYVDGEITTVNSSISTVESNLATTDAKATSAKTIAMLGL